MTGHNKDITSQKELLESIIRNNEFLFDFIEKSSFLGLKDYYIGSGCIAQTVWNHVEGFEPMYGIDDIDFVYFDSSDLSIDAENKIAKRVNKLIKSDVNLDIINQARVHLWYEEHFGYPLKPYSSLESAINTWPTTATSIGVRLENTAFKVYAPYGLNDLFGMIVRANKTQINENTYIKKVDKWTKKWSSLIIVPW